MLKKKDLYLVHYTQGGPSFLCLRGSWMCGLQWTSLCLWNVSFGSLAAIHSIPSPLLISSPTPLLISSSLPSFFFLSFVLFNNVFSFLLQISLILNRRKKFSIIFRSTKQRSNNWYPLQESMIYGFKLSQWPFKSIMVCKWTFIYQGLPVDHTRVFFCHHVTKDVVKEFLYKSWVDLGAESGALISCVLWF